MQESKIKTHLEVITNVAVLLTAMAVLSALSWGYFSQKRQPSLKNGLQKGDVLTKIASLDYRNSSQTLLIAMNTECHFCTESVPFYNHLVKSRQGQDETARIIAIFPNKENEVNQYVQQHRLQTETIAAVNLSALNMVNTPTVILVDSGGKILDFWVGKLQENMERQVIKSITTPKE